jgi:hypothetical protein
LSAILPNPSTTPGGNQIQIIPGATEYAAPLVKCFTPAGVEVSGDQTGQSFIAEVINSPYR